VTMITPDNKHTLSEDEDNDKPPLWLITFTDVAALMLTFFVMLYSMSVPDEEKWKQTTSAFNEGLKKFETPIVHTGIEDTVNIERIDYTNALNLDYLEAIVREMLGRNGNENLRQIDIFRQADSLVLSVPASLLFDTQTAEVSVEGKRTLFSIGGPLSRIRNRIEVVGHSAPSAMAEDSGFSSTWDLSLARAVGVAAVLESVGYSRPIVVHGLSSARYAELPLSMPEEKRLDLARRVDIVIMHDDGSRRVFVE
jgi:chemotaxis protein MotB